MSANDPPMQDTPATSTSIVVTVPDEIADVVTDRMWQWGVQAVSEVAAEGGGVEISTSVGNDPTAVERALRTLDPDWQVEVRHDEVRIVSVDPAHLSPTWYAPDMVSVPAPLHPITVGPEVLVTVIDAGAAFGLGDHPTTSTTMALLAQHLAPELARRTDLQPGRDRPSAQSLLDVGCGTGALAVLAAQLGVPTIRAIDIADAAVEATLANMDLNGVAGRIVVDTTPIGDLDGTYDVITANILAPVLVAMAADLQRLLAPGGALIISGILADRHDHVLAALQPLTPVRSRTQDGWISIVLTDRS